MLCIKPTTISWLKLEKRSSSKAVKWGHSRSDNQTFAILKPQFQVLAIWRKAWIGIPKNLFLRTQEPIPSISAASTRCQSSTLTKRLSIRSKPKILKFLLQKICLSREKHLVKQQSSKFRKDCTAADSPLKCPISIVNPAASTRNSRPIW